MRTSPASLGLVLVLASSLGCEPTRPQAPPASPQAPAAPPAPASPTYDLTPVAEPTDIVGIARWKSPKTSLAHLGGCAGLPPELVEQGPKELIHSLVRRRFRGAVDPTKVEEIIAQDAPVDAIVTLDPGARTPRPLFAIAVGLRSIEQAKRTLESAGPLAEVAPGMWRAGAKESRGPSCIVAVAAGAAKARLVCGEREKEVVALAPYLTRTLPTIAPTDRDLHAELRFTAIDARFGELLRQQLRGLPVLAQSQATLGDPTFDEALIKSATALGDEIGALVGDLDRLTLDIGTDTNVCLSGNIGLQMRGKAS